MDVAVVGAGPAGSAAANVLARSGRSVLVVDRAGFPRDKCCGDGLTTLALRLCEQLGLDPADLGGWQQVGGAVVHSPSGRRVHFPLPSGEGQFAAVVPRAELDAALLDLARAAGAEVHEGCALAGALVDRGGGSARLEVDGLGTVVADRVVAADGMWSPTRRFLGLAGHGYRGEWHAFRQYVEGAGPGARDLHVWFMADLLPGYAWSFPLPGDRANVGFGLLRGGRLPVGSSGGLWAGLMDRPEVRRVLGDDVRPEGRHASWPIPARVTSAVLHHGPVLFAGDAACATDALTGEGIGQALLTGMLAAEAIMEGGSSDEVARNYEAAVRGRLWADHRMSVLLQRILARPAGARAAVRVAGLTGWTRRNFARWLFEDYPRALVATPGRWQRGALGRRGAWA